MALSRRTFLAGSLAGLTAASGACSRSSAPRSAPSDGAPLGPAAVGTSGMAPGSDAGGEWESVRSQFDLSGDWIHMSALLIASHPRPVRDAIEQYRRGLDADPVTYLQEQNGAMQARARQAAAEYLGGRADDVALTDSTTMGLGLLYGGLRLRPGQHVLTTSNDYFATHEALRAAAAGSAVQVREIPLYDHGEEVSEGELVDRLMKEVQPSTRVLALTWVHSSTGLKMPLAAIADALRRVNQDRSAEARVLLCADGVHGFGIESAGVDDLGVDFFAAGCHKWLFGPRGTGVLWGKPEAWPLVQPTIPSFTDDDVWHAWLYDRDPRGPSNAARVMPGGFKAFEHQWAMADAFEWQEGLGRERVAQRTHALARQLKEGLAAMSHVRLMTPMDDALSAGIVSFDAAGTNPHAVVRRLKERRIIATVTPYARMHARLAPSIRNTEEEVEEALRAIRDLT